MSFEIEFFFVSPRPPPIPSPIDRARDVTYDDDDAELNVLGCGVDISGTN